MLEGGGEQKITVGKWGVLPVSFMSWERGEGGKE